MLPLCHALRAPNVKQDELKLLGEFDEAGIRSGQRMKLPPSVSSAAMSYDGFFRSLVAFVEVKASREIRSHEI